jgi:hypothetical protein
LQSQLATLLVKPLAKTVPLAIEKIELMCWVSLDEAKAAADQDTTAATALG